MNMFKDFSYRLLRTFALTTLACAVLLLYMGFQAAHSNTVFLIAGIIMIVLTVLFAYFSWQNYQHRPISLQEHHEIYSSVCPHCGEMLKAEDTQCPQCGTKLS